MPLAAISHLNIPPKRLTKINFTSSSDVIMLYASIILSSEALPPTSKKFAGSAPAFMVMSIVAIASPAPFTMHPTSPPLNLIYARSFF